MALTKEQEAKFREARQVTEAGLKKGRGGRRVGAGRKPNYLKRLAMPPVTAALILAQHDEIELWSTLLRDSSADVRLRTAMYLTDRRDGRPKQAVDVSGGLVHAHTTYRNPRLAGLSADELKQFDIITAKLALPAGEDSK